MHAGGFDGVALQAVGTYDHDVLRVGCLKGQPFDDRIGGQMGRCKQHLDGRGLEAGRGAATRTVKDHGDSFCQRSRKLVKAPHQQLPCKSEIAAGNGSEVRVAMDQIVAVDQQSRRRTRFCRGG